MELKLVCDCGQKFKFDVEPVNGQMPFSVNCPGCGSDRTGAANTALGQIAFVVENPARPSVRINRPPAPVTSADVPRPPAGIQRPAAPMTPKPASREPGEFNLGLGILGALIGAALG